VRAQNTWVARVKFRWILTHLCVDDFAGALLRGTICIKAAQFNKMVLLNNPNCLRVHEGNSNQYERNIAIRPLVFHLRDLAALSCYVCPIITESLLSYNRFLIALQVSKTSYLFINSG
jgi:hypothetical protein